MEGNLDVSRVVKLKIGLGQEERDVSIRAVGELTEDLSDRIKSALTPPLTDKEIADRVRENQGVEMPVAYLLNPLSVEEMSDRLTAVQIPFSEVYFGDRRSQPSSTSSRK